MSQKGQRFEREVCRLFSEWFSEGMRDDLFWRSSGSGARAKVRGRAGKTTAGHYGDICPTDRDGSSLTDLITFELKKGYSKYSLMELLDRPNQIKTQRLWEAWIQQAAESAEQAQSMSWMIVYERDRQIPVVMMPTSFAKACQEAGNSWTWPKARFILRVRLFNKVIIPGRRGAKKQVQQEQIGVMESDVTVTTLRQFLKCMTPTNIRNMLDEFRASKNAA